MLDQRRHVVELQSLRGLAALVVLASHCFSYYDTPLWFSRTKDLLFNGQGAVVLFFVLSGFVLGNSLKSAPLAWRGLGAYFTKRAFRIYPALWAASAVGFAYVALLHFNAPHPDASTWFVTRFRRERYVPIRYILALAGALDLLVPPVWSIFNELVGSAFLPFTTRLTFDRPRWGVGLFVLLGLLAMTFGPASFNGLLLYPMDFQAGVLIALLFSRKPELRRPSPVWPVLFVLGALASGCGRGLVLLVDPNLTQNDPIMHLVELAGAAAIIVAIIAGPLAFLRNRAVKYLGDISYSVYLLHFPVMGFTGVALSHVLTGAALTPWLSLELCVITLAVTILLATPVYRFIELPFIALGKRAAGLFQRVGGPSLRSGAEARA